MHFCLACFFSYSQMQFSWLTLLATRQNSDIRLWSEVFLTLYQLPSIPCACPWHCAFSAVLYFYLQRFNNTQTKANIFLVQHGPSTGAKFFIWCLAEEITICFHAAGVWSHRLWELYWLITVCFREFQDSGKKGGGAGGRKLILFEAGWNMIQKISPTYFWELETFTAESSWCSRGQVAVLRSPLPKWLRLTVQCLYGAEETLSDSRRYVYCRHGCTNDKDQGLGPMVNWQSCPHMDQVQEGWPRFPYGAIVSDQCTQKLATTASSSQMFTVWDCSCENFQETSQHLPHTVPNKHTWVLGCMDSRCHFIRVCTPHLTLVYCCS